MKQQIELVVTIECAEVTNARREERKVDIVAIDMKLSTQVILLAAVTMLVVVMLVMADEDICDDINAKGLLKMNSMFLYDNRLYIFQGDKYYSESTFGWVVDPKKPLFTLRGKHFIESKKSHFKERMAIVNYLRPHNNIDKNSDLLYKGDDCKCTLLLLVVVSSNF